MARGQPYLAAQIMSKYGKRQVASVESYTERSFSVGLQGWPFARKGSWSVIREGCLKGRCLGHLEYFLEPSNSLVFILLSSILSLLLL